MIGYSQTKAPTPTLLLHLSADNRNPKILRGIAVDVPEGHVSTPPVL